MKPINRSRLAPVKPKRTSPKPYTQNMFATHQNTQLVEMLKSLSLCPCRARMQLQNTSMSLDIEFAHVSGMHTSLSVCHYRAKTFTLNPKHKKANQGQPRVKVNPQSNHQIPKIVGMAWHRLGGQGSRQNGPGRILLAMAIELKTKKTD